MLNLDVPAGGNYWDKFDEPSEGCYDSNSDGYCDSSHTVSGLTDYLPLVSSVTANSIDVISAVYDSGGDDLTVEASSGLGGQDSLELYGFGAMKWSNHNGTWSITARNIGGDPLMVTVCGLEGCQTVHTVAQ